MKKNYILLICTFLILIIVSLGLFKFLLIDPKTKLEKKKNLIKLISAHYDLKNYQVAKEMSEQWLVDNPKDIEMHNLLNKIILAEKDISRKEKLAKLKKEKEYRQELLALMDNISLELDNFPYIVERYSKKNIDKFSDMIQKTYAENVTSSELEDNNKKSRNPYAEKLIKEGIEAYKKQNYSLAKKKFYEALMIDNDDPVANAFYGTIVYEENPENTKNFDIVIEKCSKALKEDNEIEIAHFTIARIYQQKGLNSNAIDSYNETLRINPNNLLAYYNLGRIYYSECDYKKAEDFFMNTIKIKKDFIYCYFYLSKTHLALNNSSLAKEYLWKVLEINPNLYNAYAGLGDLYFLEKNYINAINNYKKASTLYNYHLYYYKIGESFDRQENQNEAVNYYYKSISSNPCKSNEEKKHYVLSYEKIISIKLNSGKIKEASKIINEAINKLGNDSNNLFYISGEINQKQNKIYDAVNDYLKYINACPLERNKYEAYYNIAVCFEKAKDLEKAEEAYKKSMDLNPNHLEAYLNLGKLYYSLKEYSKAKDILEELIERNPNYSKMSEINKMMSKINKLN